MSELGKLFGAAVSVVSKRDNVAARQAWEQYDKLALRIKRASVAHYITMLHAAGNTNMQHFKSGMETWDRLLEDYAGAPDVGAFSKLTRTAEVVLKEDLAHFEIDYIATTLLCSPVCLLEVISLRQNDSSWIKPLTDAFKVLTLLVEKYPDCAHIYRGDILKACQLPLEARVRAAALQCVTSLVPRSLAGVAVQAYIRELETPVTCKAPIAALVGAIVEFHPEEMMEEYYRVWRAYLALLEGSKNTEAVRGAALCGAVLVVRQFGDQLPLCELSLLWTPAVGPLFDAPATRDAVLELVSQHAPLFRELVVPAAGLRSRLWAALEAPRAPAAARAALRAVYDILIADMTDTQLQSALSGEVSPRLAGAPRVRHAAARVLRAARAARGVPCARPDRPDVRALEFQLRGDGELTEHVAEAVWWCIESGVEHSEVLLQTAILCHHRLSPDRVRDIIVRGMQGAAADHDDSPLSFLISESCHPEGLPRYLPVWGPLLQAEGGRVRGDLLARVARGVWHYLEGDDAQLPESLLSLLRVAASVLAGGPECPSLAMPVCAALQRAPLPPAPLMLLLPLLPLTEQVLEIYKSLDIWRMCEEQSLCACALALLHAPPSALLPARLLRAIQLVLSRGDAEPATLSRAVRQLATLLDTRQGLDDKLVSQVMMLVERLRSRVDRSNKEGRELRWEIDRFLGKYSEGELESCESDELDELMSQLRDQLTLSVPAHPDHDDYTINLQGMLLLAIEHEDQPSLDALSAIICAQPGGPSPPQLRALCACLGAQARGAAGGAPPPRAPLPPGLAPLLLEQICRCESPGARRVLCDVMQPLLRGDTLRDVARQLTHMLAREHLVSKLAALDVSVPVITALKEHSLLTREHLPAVLLALAHTNELAAAAPFTLAAGLYADSVHLLGAAALGTTLGDLLLMLLALEVSCVKAYTATVAMTVEFLKKIFDSEEGRCKVESKFVEVCEKEGETVKSLYVLAKLRRSFGLGGGLVARGESRMARYLFHLEVKTDWEREVVLVFVAEFADVLLKSHHEPTTECIGRLIEQLPPTSVPPLRRALAACLAGWGGAPRELCLRLAAWLDGQPVDEIIANLREQEFPPCERACMSALRTLLDTLRPPLLPTLLPALAPLLPAVLPALLQHADSIQQHAWYLTDVLSVGLRFLSTEELKRLLLQGPDQRGLALCREYMPAFYSHLVRKPFILCSEEMRPCCSLLRDIVLHCAATPCDNARENVLELTDQLFPWYLSDQPPSACAAVLRGAVRLGAGDSCTCVGTATAAVEDAGTSEALRAALVAVLPPGDTTERALVSFSRSLPARVTECVGPRGQALRSVLDAVASWPHPTLLAVLARLAAGEGVGWWEPALSACMSSLGAGAGAGEALHAVYRHMDPHALSTRPVDTMLVPLICGSPPSVVERWYSPLLPALVTSLSRGQVPAAAHVAYHRCVVTNTVTVTLLRYMVEKVPRASLESPTSLLHSELGSAADGSAPAGSAAAGSAPRPWLAVREVCKLCVALQKRTVVPPGAEPALAAAVLTFQQRAYNALCACVCAWRAGPRLYACVCDWDALVGCEHYPLPIQSTWNRRSLVAGAVGGAAGDPRGTGGTSGGLTRGTTASSRQRVFLRTLSECPLNFDLFDEEDDECERVELIISESALNRHPCAASISALLRHLAATPPTPSTAPVTPEWVVAVCDVLRTGRTNVRWLVAQCVVNVRVELHTFAGELCGPLLAIVGGGGDLNSLHVDIITTVTSWSPLPPTCTPPATLLRSVASQLVVACMSRRGTRVSDTLLQCWTGFLRTFPDTELLWDDFSSHLDDPAASKSCYQLLLRASRAGAHVPGLLPALIDRLADIKHSRQQMSELGKLFGAAVSVVSKRDDVAARQAWEQYDKLALRNKCASVAHYITMLHAAGNTNMQHFNAVCDIAQKASGERARCISVLLALLRAHPREAARALGAAPPDLATDLMEKAHDVAFEEVFRQLAPSPPAKRARVSPSRSPAICASRSPVLATRGDERALAAILARLDDREERLDKKMSADDMVLRFVECYYAYVYLPAVHPPHDHSRGLTHMLTSLLRPLRRHTRFQRGAVPRAPPRGACSTQAGACGTRAARASRGSRQRARESSTTEEAPLSIDNILETFIEFGKSCEMASTWLVGEMWRACSAHAPRELADMLAGMLAATVGAAPHLLRLAAELAPHLPNLEPFNGVVQDLCGRWSRSVARPELMLLREEVDLRNATLDTFTLGEALPEESPLEPGEDVAFSIEGLVQSFGSLSPRAPRPHRVPPVWTSREHFRGALGSCTVAGPPWWTCMVQTWRGDTHSATRVARAASRWPHNRFDLAAVTEALEWSRVRGRDVEESETAAPRAPAFAPGDCLVEWAARLMIRSLYLSDREDGEAVSRSHELAWCARATEMGLHELAMQCVRRNTSVHVAACCSGALAAGAVVPWLGARLAARGGRGDRPALEKVCHAAERHGPVYYSVSAPRAVLQLNQLLVQLRAELGTLTDDKLQEMLEAVDAALERDGTLREGDSMRKLCETAILYYHDTRGNRDISSCITLMCGVLRRSSGQASSEASVALVLSLLTEPHSLTEQAARCLLETLSALAAGLPAWCGPVLRSVAAAAPRVWPARSAPARPDLDQCRRRLALLCGAEVSLLQQCDKLATALRQHDEESWRLEFERMRRDVFEDPEAGTDYLALYKYKLHLYSIQDPALPVSSRLSVLQTVSRAVTVHARQSRGSRSVSQLSPALSHDTRATNAALAELLRLEPGDVIGLEDEIPVFRDSVTSPGVVCVVTRRGRRRYVIKRERLALDAAASAAAAALLGARRLPQVVLLSEECGLMEYLEGHERMRDLILAEFDIDNVPAVSGTMSVPQFAAACAAVPHDTLRRALRRRSGCVERFLRKQSRFLRDLTHMTLLTWLFGWGDRHLANILVCGASGAVVGVDWGGLFQYSAREPPPARLTRPILALVPDGLAGALQGELGELRAAAPLRLAPARAAFRHLAPAGPGRAAQLSTLEALLKGTMLPCDAVRHNGVSHVTPCVTRATYSPHEQVACLLRLSTSPRILALTRPQWEPWT